MTHIHGYYLEDLCEGMSEQLSKTITTADVQLFADLSGDTNPVHLEESYARETMFGKKIVHGMFSAALISAVAGTKLPGPGAIYIDQSIKFRAPVFIGDTAIASVTVTVIDHDRKRIKCQTDVHVGDRLVATGEATYMVDSRA